MEPSAASFVTLVTGLPRSGTSLLMQMLRAGGLPVLSDDSRPADPDNPRGYLEYAPVRASARDPSWVAAARGRAVKIVYRLVPELPRDERYRVLLLRRALVEVLASQREMLRRGGADPDPGEDALLARTFERQLAEFSAWVRRAGLPLLEVQHRELLSAPRPTAAAVAAFLGSELDLDAMAGCVEPALHRQRAGEC